MSIKKEAKNLKNEGKITLKDYIAWSLTSISIIISVLLGLKNKQLETNRSIIHTSIQNVQQYTVNNNYNLPPLIQQELKNIAFAAGESITFENANITFSGEPVTYR
jgi:hypothetical protein